MARDIKIQAQIESHAEAHAAVNPALAFTATASFPDRHERQRLNSAEFHILVLVVGQNQSLCFLEEVVSCR